MLAFTYHLAASGGPHRIRANAILPGMIRTPSTEFLFTEPGRAGLGARAGEPARPRGRARGRRQGRAVPRVRRRVVRERGRDPGRRRCVGRADLSGGPSRHQLDEVPVRVGDERDALPGLGRGTRRPHGAAACRDRPRERGVEVVDGERDVAGPASQRRDRPVPLLRRRHVEREQLDAGTADASTTNAISTPSGTRAVVVCSRPRTSRYQRDRPLEVGHRQARVMEHRRPARVVRHPCLPSFRLEIEP